jgi:uncharacterized protein (TIGR02231 family)
MKALSSLCCLLALLAALPARATEPVAAESSITDVIVYADRAQITRTAEVPLGVGETRIAIHALPDTLFDDSVRAAGKASLPVSIRDVEVRRNVREQLRDDALAALEEQLQRLRDEAAALQSRRRVIDEQRDFLKQIQIKAAGDISRDIQINKLDVAQLKELPAFLGAELARLEEATGKIAADTRALSNKFAVAEAEFNKRRAAASRADKTVVVTVAAEAATKLRLQVSYVLGNASWQPLYDARSQVDAGGVELAYNAVVRQQTGEDWRGVNLSLSAARPAIGARMPEVAKWELNFQEYFAQQAPGFGIGMFRKAAPAARDEVLRIEPLTIGAAPQEMQVQQGVTAATFRVPRPADVPSDGEPHRQTVSIQKIPAGFVYEITPKLSAFAYLKAAATNSTDAPLLAGAVNVFVGPDFVGSGRIDTVAPTEPFDLFLGIDEGIRVKREALKEKTGKAGIFRNRKKQTFGYKITVENYKDKPQRVVVYEQLPVSGNDEIKVTAGEYSPKLKEIDEATGKLTWELELSPRQKREIIYDFTVDWPQDRPISGL